MNTVKKVFAAMVAAFSFSASAAVIMTDGTLAVYDPNEDYIPSGVLGPAEDGRYSTWSVGWVFTDPSRIFITLALPDDFIGRVLWGTSSEFDVRGLLYSEYGDLGAGESATAIVGGFRLATLTRPFTGWFSVIVEDPAAFLPFGPAVAGRDSVVSYSNGIGDPPNPNPVPEPDALALIGLGLVATAVVTRRRRKADD